MSYAYDALEYNIESCTDGRPANVYFWDGKKPEDYPDAYWDQMNDNSWDTLYCEAAIDCVEDFEDEDWERLLRELPDKSTAWQWRVEDCMVEPWSPQKIKVLLLLAKTDDVELFARVMGDLLECGLSDADGMTEVYEKAEKMMRRPDGTTRSDIGMYVWLKRMETAGWFDFTKNPTSGAVDMDVIRDAREGVEGILQGAGDSMGNSLKQSLRRVFWWRTLKHCVHGPEDESLVLDLLQIAMTEEDKGMILTQLRSCAKSDGFEIDGMDRVYEEAEKLLRNCTGSGKYYFSSFLETRPVWDGFRVARSKHHRTVAQ